MKINRNCGWLPSARASWVCGKVAPAGLCRWWGATVGKN